MKTDVIFHLGMWEALRAVEMTNMFGTQLDGAKLLLMKKIVDSI